MIRDTRRRARQGLDERLAGFKPQAHLPVPPRGWIRAIRDALGMSGSQLAARLDVRPQTIDAIEKSEVAGTVQLNTLRRAAEAMDCTLVYALVPRTSLQDAVGTRARALAVSALQRVAHTMTLEAQQTGDDDRDARIEAYIRDVIRDRDLWDDR